MFVDFGGVCLFLLTAVVFARDQLTEVQLSEVEISSPGRRIYRNNEQDGSYQHTDHYLAGLVDPHPNLKSRKISGISFDQNSAPGLNSDENYKLFGTDLGSSSDHNNEAALGDDYFELLAQDKVLFDSVGVLPRVIDQNQTELQESTQKRGVRTNNKPPSTTVGEGGVETEQFHFEFNYTIDVSDMSLACQDGRVSLSASAHQLVLAVNNALRLSQALLQKYVNWAYDAPWEDYSHLIHEDLDARYVPLLPSLPEDFNHSVIRSKQPTTPRYNFLPVWIQQKLSSSSHIQPGPIDVTSLDAVTSLDQVLPDTYSVMELCKAATDSVLLEQALSSYPMISDLVELTGSLERVLGVLWNVLVRCNVDPNPEPLQHILELVYERETVDDIKRRGFLTIYHTERALDYVKHIMKQIDPSLGDLS